MVQPMLLLALLATATYAWSGEAALGLPPSESPSEWSAALNRQGLDVGAGGVRVTVEGSTWRLAVDTPAGRREAVVPAPRTEADREAVAALAAALLAAGPSVAPPIARQEPRAWQPPGVPRPARPPTVPGPGTPSMPRTTAPAAPGPSTRTPSATAATTASPAATPGPARPPSTAPSASSAPVTPFVTPAPPEASAPSAPATPTAAPGPPAASSASATPTAPPRPATSAPPAPVLPAPAPLGPSRTPPSTAPLYPRAGLAAGALLRSGLDAAVVGALDAELDAGPAWVAVELAAATPTAITDAAALTWTQAALRGGVAVYQTGRLRVDAGAGLAGQLWFVDDRLGTHQSPGLAAEALVRTEFRMSDAFSLGLGVVVAGELQPIEVLGSAITPGPVTVRPVLSIRAGR